MPAPARALPANASRTTCLDDPSASKNKSLPHPPPNKIFFLSKSEKISSYVILRSTKLYSLLVLENLGRFLLPGTAASSLYLHPRPHSRSLLRTPLLTLPATNPSASGTDANTDRPAPQKVEHTVCYKQVSESRRACMTSKQRSTLACAARERVLRIWICSSRLPSSTFSFSRLRSSTFSFSSSPRPRR